MKIKNTHFQIIILIVGLILALVKFLIYFHSNALSIFSDAMESMVNIIAGTFTLYSLYLSSLPADREHPYGHGKIENIAAGLEGGLLFLAGVFSVYKTLESILLSNQIEVNWLDTIIVLVLGFFNYILGWWSTFQGQKTNSPALVASGMHLKMDGYTSVGLVIGLVLVVFTSFRWIDWIVGVVFGISMVYQGIKILKDSINSVLDTADLALIQKMIQYISEHRKPQWIDIHNLRIQKFGAEFHIDAHITFPWYYTNLEVHNELNSIQELINLHFGKKVELFIHPDPCIPVCCSLCSIQNCKERINPFVSLFPWTIENVLENEKHSFS